MFWGGCYVDSCSAAGPLGTAFWRCIFGGRLAMPKLYHHYGPQGRRSWPQDGSNAAVRQPTCLLDGCTCPPVGLVGAGRAIGALAVELCILAKESYAYSARGAFLFARARLWLSCRATGESVLDVRARCGRLSTRSVLNKNCELFFSRLISDHMLNMLNYFNFDTIQTAQQYTPLCRYAPAGFRIGITPPGPSYAVLCTA